MRRELELEEFRARNLFCAARARELAAPGGSGAGLGCQPKSAGVSEPGAPQRPAHLSAAFFCFSFLVEEAHMLSGVASFLVVFVSGKPTGKRTLILWVPK